MAGSRKKEKEEEAHDYEWREEAASLLCAEAYQSLAGFIQIVSNFTWLPAPHLLKLCDALEKVERGEITRLRVTMPPRHGKSYVVSHHFPAWFMGRNPEKSVILSSYAADLAYDFSRACRGVIRSYGGDIFGVKLSPDSSAVDRWELQNHRGAFTAAGVGGPLTGRGASLIIIDDPLKNREVAESQVMRNHLWEWYTSTLYTRLAPGGAIVLVQTRWHDDDLYGRLDDQSGENWITINFPAIAEGDDILGRNEGDPLWPDMYPLPVLRTIEAEVGPYDWAALYQQHPIPKEGGMFKPEWFPIVPGAPVDARYVRRWDWAATEGAGDWTVGLLMGVKEGIYYIKDVIRLQGSSGTTEKRAKQAAVMDGRDILIRWEKEGGSAGEQIANHLSRTVFRGYGGLGVRSTGSKVDRARPAASTAEAGNVRLVKGNWNKAFLDEISVFPYGRFDDQVDAFSGAMADLSGVKTRKKDKKYAKGHGGANI